MGRRYLNAPTSDQNPTRKARKTSSHTSSSSTCSSSAQKPVQQTTQSAKVIEASGLDQSDIPRTSTPSFAALQRTRQANQSTLQGKKHRNLAPAPTDPPRPRPLANAESIMSRNGNLKFLIPKLDAPPIHTPSALPLAKSLATTTQQFKTEIPKHQSPPTQQFKTEIPKHQSPPPQQSKTEIPIHQAPLSPFDPSSCAWRALRDVAFVMDNWIELSMEGLCALLRFRYGGEDPQMWAVERCHILAMKQFCEGRGKVWYEIEARGLIKKRMERDLVLLRRMVEKGEVAVSEDY